MVRQIINSYVGSCVGEIREQIFNDCKKFDVPIKTVSLSSHAVYGSSRYSAIVVFEEVKENE